MYTLYYSQGACSVATQVVLNELKQTFILLDVNKQDNFKTINPVGAVPVLNDGENNLTEGAAILLYLLDKHPNTLLASQGPERQKAIQDIMFANATMHPAYGRLFFISQHIQDETVKQQALESAAAEINRLWQVIENELAQQNALGSQYLGGKSPSPADIMLTVYASWGVYFSVDIELGVNSKRMLEAVENMPSYQSVLAAESALNKDTATHA